MGILFDSNSKWNADHKIDKQQHRRDILGFRTSSRPNHESQRDAELLRIQARKEAKANQDGGLFSCATLALAMAGGVLAVLAGMAYGAAKAFF